MNQFEKLVAYDYEQLIAFQNRETGLRGFICIHDTSLGPALGGCRIWKYESDDAALEDVLRLSRGMTYKASLAGLHAGGGKAVIIHHPGLKREAAFEAFGRLVESLRGRFFTGVDVGTTAADLAAMSRVTRYCAFESSPALGDISQHTAIGVWHGLRACLDFSGIAGSGRKVRVAIQGLGGVGMHLALILHREGFELLVADINPAAVKKAETEFGARAVAPDEVLGADCDVLAPCALGAILNAQSIPQIRAGIICGCANNQLAAPEDGDALARRGILYAPDYLVNAGGLIRGADFYLSQIADSLPNLAKIHERTTRVLSLARERNTSTARIADELAESRLKPRKTYADLTWSYDLPNPA